jgi:hypothetical protein
MIQRLSFPQQHSFRSGRHWRSMARATIRSTGTSITFSTVTTTQSGRETAVPVVGSATPASGAGSTRAPDDPKKLAAR